MQTIVELAAAVGTRVHTFPSREAWEQGRKAFAGVSASDVPTLLPEYCYKLKSKPTYSPEELWMEYKGLAKRQLAYHPRCGRAGNWFQERNIAFFANETGMTCTNVDDTVAWHPQHPWLLMSPDGVGYGPGHEEATPGDVWANGVRPPVGPCLLEAKNVGDTKWSPKEDNTMTKYTPERPPNAVVAQVQAQLMVLPLPCAVVVAKIGAWRIRGYVIYPDPVLQAMIASTGLAFCAQLRQAEWNPKWYEAAL